MIAFPISTFSNGISILGTKSAANAVAPWAFNILKEGAQSHRRFYHGFVYVDMMLQRQPRDQPANKILLALLGANFYVCAWDEPRNYGEVLSVNEYLRFHPTIRPKGPVQLHELALYSVRSTKRYTKSFKITNPERCDTIVENAGSSSLRLAN